MDFEVQAEPPGRGGLGSIFSNWSPRLREAVAGRFHPGGRAVKGGWLVTDYRNDRSYVGFRGDYNGLSLAGRSTLRIADEVADVTPLVVAIHGGTYTSQYFDIPGYSLLDRANAIGIPLIAPDRPGYGGSAMPPPEESGIEHSAMLLDRAIGSMFERVGKDTRGVVLIGHSIGAAIAALIAARGPSWPLLGLAMSGICLTPPPGADAEAWAALPDLPFVDMPADVKDHVMFGPVGTYPADMPRLSHEADAPIPRKELLDITTVWPALAPAVLKAITVPVHYRQGEFDAFWITDAEQVEAFGACCAGTPSLDAALVVGSGHCIDFHRSSAELHDAQLAFALWCGKRFHDERRR